MQREIPTDMLSRLSAYDMFGSLVFLPIGLALVGPVTNIIGEKATLVGSSVLLIALVAATLFVPSVWQLRRADESDEMGSRPTPINT
jgi:MFS family permease